VLLILDVCLVRICGGRVIWTIHNLYGHESRNHEGERRARRLLLRLVNQAAVHSEGARDLVSKAYGAADMKKISVIPHGNYIGSYPEDSARSKALADQFGVRKYACAFLFFGALRGYKGLDDLISAFGELDRTDVCLIVAGKPDTPETETRLKEAAAKDARIILHIGFVPDADVAALFAISDAVVLPFHRILTSGSAVLAMSMGKALVLPEDTRHLGGVDDQGVQFYEEGRLGEALEQITRRDTDQMGRFNLDQVRPHNWPEIGRLCLGIYEPGSGAEET
jgi:glycosyltransferase involved in cell wall biosynthesis